MADFIEDIGDYPIQSIDAGIRAYRRSPTAKRFPTPGQLRLLVDEHYEKNRPRGGGPVGPVLSPQFGDSRPALWWMLSRQFWLPHWHVDQIPEPDLTMFLHIEAKRKSI